MPQLPSGRHVAFSHDFQIDPEVPGGGVAALERIETVDDLAPFISVDLFRAPTRFDGHRLAAQPALAPASHAPPPDLIPHPSGHTLADLDALTSDWEPDDTNALHEFIASERFQRHLLDLLRQIHIATGKVAPTFVDAVLYNPEIRALFEAVDD